MSEKLGKIEHCLFDSLIRERCGHPRAEVSTGPEFGVDVSVVDLPGGLAMAMTSDPLSLIPSLGLEESAWLSVHLMANDMATTGFAPMYGQITLNLPASLAKNDFKTYWEHIHRFCSDIGLSITGGHTGFIEGQNSTIAGGGTFISIAPKAQILTSKMARSGDVILVSKQCAISSAAILAMSFPETVKNKAGHEIYQLAAESFYQTSSMEDALAARGDKYDTCGISAMHDVTEGGVLGAIYELARASGNGARITKMQLPVGEVQQAVCNLFELDPRYCIGAGSMIITCREEAAGEVISRLQSRNISCTIVGKLTDHSSGIRLVNDDGLEEELIYQDEDPYWAAFFKALKAGWK